MQDGTRWVVAIVVAAAILALLLFARGGEERGNPEETPAAVAIHRLA